MTTSRRVIACGALVIATLIPAAAQTAARARGTALELLRFTSPAALPGVTLEPGAYTFEVERHDSPELIRVRDSRSDRIVFDAPARPADRPRGLNANKSIVFGEASTHQPLPILAWFPRDRMVGYEFEYARPSK